MATDTLEFKLVMRPAKMNFAVATHIATTENASLCTQMKS